MKNMLITTLAVAALGISASPFAISDVTTGKDGTYRDQTGAGSSRDQTGAGSMRDQTGTAAVENNRSGSIGQFVDDATVTTKVKTALASDDVTKARNIDVETTKGVVVLSGQVDSKVEAERATSVARSIQGVVEVRNLLTAR